MIQCTGAVHLPELESLQERQHPGSLDHGPPAAGRRQQGGVRQESLGGDAGLHLQMSAGGVIQVFLC